MDLKTKAVVAALRVDEELYLSTRNPSHVWHAWQLARRAKVQPPDWVTQFIDRLARSECAVRSRKRDTAERYEAALTQMEVAVLSHKRRVRIRDVGKQLGVDVKVSRRDTPNLSAIARAAAEAHGVSVNRLLARYRASRLSR
jgi:hypothetical protein